MVPCIRGRTIEPISLRTDRLLLRPWREEDLQPFTALNSDPEVMRYFPRLLDRDATATVISRMQAHFERFGFGFWPVELPGEAPFIGIIGMMITPFETHFTPCLETGWRLARPYWGHGYAQEGARAAFDLAFGQLPVDQVVAYAVKDNERSCRVMMRLGMVSDAKDDFDHPLLAEDDQLRRHCLYRMSKERWRTLAEAREGEEETS